MEVGQLAQWLEIQNRERQKIMRDIQTKAEKQIIIDDKSLFCYLLLTRSITLVWLGWLPQGLPNSIIVHRSLQALVRNIREVLAEASLNFTSLKLWTNARICWNTMVVMLLLQGLPSVMSFFQSLIARMQNIAKEQLEELDLRPKIFAETEIPLSDLKPDLLKYLGWLQPTGMGNPTPIFMSSGLKGDTSKGNWRRWFTFKIISD